MPLALRKMGEWRSHFENLMRLLGAQIVGLTRFLPSDSTNTTAQSSFLFQGVRDLLVKACVWHEGISILNSRLALYSLKGGDRFWYVRGGKGLVKTPFEKRSMKRQKMVLAEALVDCLGEGSERFLSGSVVQEMFGG